MSFFLSECTKIDVGWGFAPEWGTLQNSPDLIAGFNGAASRQEGRERTRGKREREGKGRNGEGRERGKLGE